ncbi:hypothetical protein, partial [Mesorhizobium sp. M7A.F.Ca.AU.002.02.1.1]|uniref:hypothetical protein n=1 Tax=Mesorhizobium sp. M7A.F.Ca.AU.002.02.1.1 TaxID=2496671 RepID=UPI0019D1C201
LLRDRRHPRYPRAVCEAEQAAAGVGCVDIQVMPACKCGFLWLPVLTYPKVRSAPVLGICHFRLGLT